MRKILYLACFALLFNIAPLSGFGQRAVLDFEDDLCTYKGTYDTRKYTAKQLQDSYRLVRGEFGYFDGKNITELTENYHRQKQNLTQLQLVTTPFFKILRDSILRYLDQNYTFQRISLEAEANPTLLLKYHQDQPNVKYYSTALVDGGEVLMKSYRVLIQKQMEKNVDPDRLWQQFTDDSNAPDKYTRAFRYVLRYGWWNAINAQIAHVTFDGRRFAAFHGLFIDVQTVDCDEP